MIDMMQLKGRKACVAGAARSGIAAALLLVRNGASVTLYDQKKMEDFGSELDVLKKEDIQFALGVDPLSVLEGKDLLVVSPVFPEQGPMIQESRRRGIETIAEIELASRMMDGLLVSVTGTNGKTTTTTLTHEIFCTSGRRSHAVGNIGFPFCQAVMEGGPGDVYVCECSSFQMETVNGFRPRAGAFLNLTEDHLNRHGTMEVYAGLKMRMFEKQSPSDYSIFNADDPALEAWISRTPGHVLLFSRKREVEEGAFVRDGRIIVRLEGKETEIAETGEIRIRGLHSLENALAAVLLTFVCDVPPEAIRNTLRTFPGVEHRIEFCGDHMGIRYYNDSKGTNVDSTLRALETMDRPTVVILGGSDKHADFRPLARAMKDYSAIRGAVLIGQTAPQIEQALREVDFRSVWNEKTMEDAVRRAVKEVGEGNVLLSPACASFDMFRDYEHRGKVFKEIVHTMTGG